MHEPLHSLRATVRAQALNALTLVLVGLCVWRVGLVPELPAVTAFVVGGVLLGAIDWRVNRLPTRIVYGTLAAVAAGLVFAAIVERQWVSLGTAALGGLLLSNAFFLVYVVSDRFAGMRILGLGDVRLAALLGVVLGWYGIEALVIGVAFGHLLALVVAATIAIRRRAVVVDLAFGPPLLAGALAVVLVNA